VSLTVVSDAWGAKTGHELLILSKQDPDITAVLGGDVSGYPTRDAAVAQVSEWLGDLTSDKSLVAAVLARSELAAGAPVGRLWPILSEVALYGLAGDIVREVEPETEADPAALLVLALATFGNIVGREPHFWVGATRHSVNLFEGIVGATSSGRKGTAQAEIDRLFTPADANWAANCRYPSASTGEGLIYHVRDAKYSDSKKDDTTGVWALEDKGVQDKRLMVTSSEFAQVLKVMARPENTLSPVFRQAWDGGQLATMTKQNANKASGAHVSFVGHITEDELKAQLASGLEISNGFANRFLWVCTRRSKLLPRGGNLAQSTINGLTKRIAAAVDAAKLPAQRPAKSTTIAPDLELKRDAAAEERWESAYIYLERERPDAYGMVAGRGAPQVMRLAAIYALLDQAWEIRIEHLEAALAVWDYCDQSAGYLFGGLTGNPDADAIMAAVRGNPDGLTRTDISSLFGRNRTKDQIQLALKALCDAGHIRPDAAVGLGGRSMTIYHASVPEVSV